MEDGGRTRKEEKERADAERGRKKRSKKTVNGPPLRCNPTNTESGEWRYSNEKKKEGASFTLTRTRDICRRNKTSAN